MKLKRRGVHRNTPTRSPGSTTDADRLVLLAEKPNKGSDFGRELDAVATVGAGFVERAARLVHQLGGTECVRRVARDAGRQRQRVADRAGEQCAAHPLRGPHRARFGRVLEDRADHQVAEPARGIALAQRAAHDIADDTECLQARVARRPHPCCRSRRSRPTPAAATCGRQPPVVGPAPRSSARRRGRSRRRKRARCRSRARSRVGPSSSSAARESTLPAAPR